MKKLLQGLKKMHEMNVMHRDLKPDNILMKKSKIGEYKDIVICDFGLATFFG
jgi:serine/threonine protein kinase